MKTNYLKFSAAVLALSVFSYGVFAQATPSTATKPASTTQTTPAAKPATSKTSSTPMTKEEFQKKYNEMKPKIDAMEQKAKEYASTHPEFSTEMNKLNDMVSAFKAKADKYDSVPKDQQAAYASGMKSDWSALQTQYNKLKSMWMKDNPNASKPQSK